MYGEKGYAARDPMFWIAFRRPSSLGVGWLK
jgi:hypothetical protein